MTTPRRSAAFTLIEMLAVVAIFALLASFVMPNLGMMSSRRLDQQADQLSAQLELARTRAVVTGIPHRLAIDLETGSYWLEWYVTESQAAGVAAPPPAPLDLRGARPISLAPPLEEVRDFRPLPSLFGRETAIEDSLRFSSVDTPEGSIQSGEAFVVFERDGTASATEIVLADDAGHAVALEVQPLAEAVRIHDVEL
jgi:type II secretion system protein H